MQSQFTDKAKTALLLAGRAAKSLHQNYVGTEHILLGLIKEGTGEVSGIPSVAVKCVDIRRNTSGEGGLLDGN